MNNSLKIAICFGTAIIILIIIIIFLGITKIINGTFIKTGDLYVEKICIEKHLYYYVPGLYKGGLAPVLDDVGIPIHCER